MNVHAKQKAAKIATETAKKPMLIQAEETITGARQSEYGDKRQNFAQIAMGVQMVLASKLQPGMYITPEEVALIMMQVKIARLSKSPDHKDSILDVAGYAGCFSKLQDEREAGKPLLGATVDPRDYE